MSKVSIIVPCYNVGKYIEKCLDSLISQTFKDLDILCINDGSQDNTLAILKKYAKKDKRVKVFNQDNMGIGAARNRGLQEVRSEYLMFCDADDWYDPKMCDTMYKTIVKEDVDFVVCKTREHFESDDLMRRAKNFHDWLNAKMLGRVVLDYASKSEIPQTLWDKIFKVEHIRKYDIKFPHLSGPEDIGFFFSYLSVSKIGYFINFTLYNHLTREDSIQGEIAKHSLAKSPANHLAAISHVIDFLSEWKILADNLWVYEFLQKYIRLFLSYFETEEDKVNFLRDVHILLLRVFPQNSILQVCLTGNYQRIIDFSNEKYAK